MHFELSPSIIWIALWKMNTYSQLQVNIFSNNRDITKCQSFSTITTTAPNNDDPKAIAIPLVFSENTRAKNTGTKDYIKKKKLKYVHIFYI